MITVKQIPGCSPKVYEIIGPYAMDYHVIRKRENLPIITKENYTWYVLMDGRKVKAFVAAEEIKSYTKLQAFIIVDATKTESRSLIKEVIEKFRQTNSPKLTVAVLNEYVDFFVREKFKIINHKKNWTDLAFYQYEETQ